MTTITNKQLFEDAAEIITARGWWNGSVNTNRVAGTTCVALAIEAATKLPKEDITYRDIEAPIIVLAKELGWYEGMHRAGTHNNVTAIGPYSYVTKWNDRQPDGETVVAKLREVAAKQDD